MDGAQQHLALGVTGQPDNRPEQSIPGNQVRTWIVQVYGTLPLSIYTQFHGTPEQLKDYCKDVRERNKGTFTINVPLDDVVTWTPVEGANPKGVFEEKYKEL